MSKNDFEASAWKALDNGFSEQEAMRFRETVRLDPERMGQFAKLTLLHSQIHSAIHEASGLSSGPHPKDPKSLAASAGAEVQTPNSNDGLTRHRTHPIVVAFLSVAATVVALVFSGLLRVSTVSTTTLAHVDRVEPGDISPPVGTGGLIGMSEAPPNVAMLTGAVDVIWEPGYGVLYGEFLAQGQEIRLRSGLAQLTFESGAKLVLQGPVEFITQNEMNGEIRRGKLLAVCPQQARGFKLRTPSTEILDVGTEFAVQVGNDGDTEVHVLSGEVLCRRIANDGQVEGEAISILQSNALRFVSAEQNPASVHYNDKKFVRDIQPVLSEQELPALPVRKDLALWLAADVLVKRDDSDRVLAWRDIAYGDNQSAEDAIGISEGSRPLWVRDGMNGRPCLRFNGESYLVTSPLMTTDNQTLFVVYSADPLQDGEDSTYQLVSYNGPPLHRPIRGMQRGMLQLGHVGPPVIDSYGEFNSMNGLVYSVENDQGRHSGLITSRSIPADTPTVVGYRYDYADRQAVMTINGKEEARTPAQTSIRITTRKVIGRHGEPRNFLRGDIAEVLIFNAALGDGSMGDVNEYLMKKYEIP